MVLNVSVSLFVPFTRSTPNKKTQKSIVPLDKRRPSNLYRPSNVANLIRMPKLDKHKCGQHSNLGLRSRVQQNHTNKTQRVTTTKTLHQGCSDFLNVAVCGSVSKTFEGLNLLVSCKWRTARIARARTVKCGSVSVVHWKRAYQQIPYQLSLSLSSIMCDATNVRTHKCNKSLSLIKVDLTNTVRNKCCNLCVLFAQFHAKLELRKKN